MKSSRPFIRKKENSVEFDLKQQFSFRHPLKVVVEGEYDVKLYPDDGETTTILNFKRGIVSALAVPLLEEDKNKNMVLRLKEFRCIHSSLPK